ncbi:MAG: HAD family hydrolase [Candidatus Lokiarchaeota archaeon]|nr:HAD family hydrolase [Candidatus Lokiarchaeota archaeon]
MTLENNQLIKQLQNGNIRGIIFDFDGTILDIRESLRNSVEEVYQEKKIIADTDITIQEIGALMETIQSYPLPKILLESYEMFKYISSLQNITYLKKLRIAIKIFSKYLTYAKDAPFYPDAYEFIKKYKKNFDFFIVSHNQTKNILPHLEEQRVKSFFKGIYGADLIPALKPDPNSLSIVFKSYKSCKLSEFVMIGDMPSDIIAGNEAGVWTIAIASGVSNREILFEAKPSLLIDSFQELINLIENKNITNSKNQKSIKINP